MSIKSRHIRADYANVGIRVTDAEARAIAERRVADAAASARVADIDDDIDDEATCAVCGCGLGVSRGLDSEVCSDCESDEDDA
jgi:hypothetical protein